MGPKGPTSLTPLVARARNCGRLWPVFSGFSGFCSVFVKEVAVFGRIYSGDVRIFGEIVWIFREILWKILRFCVIFEENCAIIVKNDGILEENREISHISSLKTA